MIRSGTSREMTRLLAVVVTVALIAALYLAKVVLLPLGLAILFTFLLAPVVGLLERIRIPRVLGIVLVLAIFGGGLGMIGWTVGGQLIDVTTHLHDYRRNIADKVAFFHHDHDNKLTQAQHEVQHLGAQIGVSQPSDSKYRWRSELGASPEHPLDVHEVGKSTSALSSLPAFFHPMAALLLVTVFTFFMLLEREDLRNRLIRLTGRGNLTQMTQAMDEAGNRISRYFRLQLLVNLCYGSLIFVALHWIGLPHAMLWGALAGLLRFIPYIGAPIAALLPTLLSMAVFHGWKHTLIVMAIFFCVEVLTANFIEPHLYGKHTGLSPLAILVAAVFWTLIWGPIGLILSVPLSVCLVVMGSHVPSLEFLKVLLGDEPVIRPEVHYYQRLLANDEREASEVLEAYLKENTLEDLYDAVVIPALRLSEVDRHRNTLDDATAAFIDSTTRELVQELGLRGESGGEARVKNEKASGEDEEVPEPEAVTSKSIVCVPVRDEADEIAAIMLAQLLERAGHQAEAVSVESLEELSVLVGRKKPDLVYLSALPPYAISYARSVYRKLRAKYPGLNIQIGFWGYPGDAAKAARIISAGKQESVQTTLAEAVVVAANGAAEAETGAGEAAVPA